MDLLDYCTREAVKDYESQLKVNQRVDERFQKLKAKLEIEKKDQDIYLDRSPSTEGAPNHKDHSFLRRYNPRLLIYSHQRC